MSNTLYCYACDKHLHEDDVLYITSGKTSYEVATIVSGKIYIGKSIDTDEVGSIVHRDCGTQTEIDEMIIL